MVTRVPSEGGKPKPPPPRTQTAPGSRAASTPPATAGATTTTMETKPTPWNADMSPLYLGRLGQQGAGLGGAMGPNQRAQTTVYDVSTEWLTSLKANDPDGYNLLVDNLRAGNFLGAKAKSATSIKEAFQMAAKEAAARVDAGQQTEVDLLEYIASKANGGQGATGSGGSGSGGYSGPVSSVSTMDPQSAAMLLNRLAVDKLGRNLTDDELAQYTKDFRAGEMRNPTVSSGSGPTRLTQEGMSDTDLADQIIRENPVFADNVLKTDVLDMFFNRIGGKNG